jgi:hypothetical protein
MSRNMLENSELAALSHSRLGSNQFIDDFVTSQPKQFVGFVADDEFYNLFGSKKRKSSIENVKEDETAKWAKYDTSDCKGVQSLIDDTEIEIERVTKLMASSKGFELPIQLEYARNAQAKAKTLQNQYDCLAKDAADKKEAARLESLATLTKISDASVDKAKKDVLGLGSDDTAAPTILGMPKNVVIYGGIGLGVLVVVALLFRK